MGLRGLLALEDVHHVRFEVHLVRVYYFSLFLEIESIFVAAG